MKAFHADQQPLALPPGHTLSRDQVPAPAHPGRSLAGARGPRSGAGGGRGPRARPRAALRAGDRRQRAERGRAAGDRLSVERGDGRAGPPLGRGDARRGPRRARRRRRRQPRRRHPPCERRPRQRLLRLQRRRGRGARRAGRCGRRRRRRRCRASSSSISTSTRATAPPRSSPATRASSRCRCTARRTSPSARRRATSTSACPTAAATPTTSPRSTRALAAVWREHAARPFGLAFYLAGADPHENDRLGRLKLTAAGLLERDRRVLAALRERRIPVALAMAGGYGHDIEVTVAIQAATIRAAIESWQGWKNARP